MSTNVIKKENVKVEGKTQLDEVKQGVRQYSQQEIDALLAKAKLADEISAKQEAEAKALAEVKQAESARQGKLDNHLLAIAKLCGKKKNAEDFVKAQSLWLIYLNEVLFDLAKQPSESGIVAMQERLCTLKNQKDASAKANYGWALYVFPQIQAIFQDLAKECQGKVDVASFLRKHSIFNS